MAQLTTESLSFNEAGAPPKEIMYAGQKFIHSAKLRELGKEFPHVPCNDGRLPVENLQDPIQQDRRSILRATHTLIELSSSVDGGLFADVTTVTDENGHELLLPRFIKGKDIKYDGTLAYVDLPLDVQFSEAISQKEILEGESEPARYYATSTGNWCEDTQNDEWFFETTHLLLTEILGPVIRDNRIYEPNYRVSLYLPAE